MNPSRALSATVVAVLAVIVSATTAAAVGPTISGPIRPPKVCFAPNTDRALMDAYARALGNAGESGAAHRNSLNSTMAQLSDGSRWSTTATNGGGLKQGDPTTLTWSIVPDGTPISGAIGEQAAPSNLRAFLNGIYGSQNVWLPVFQQVFDRWSELTGVTYVHQAADDGAALINTPGVLGVRADVRIGGHAIDGNYNVLAYNYFPNSADMVIDTSDSFFNNTTNNSRRLRNTVAHEHGHGLGFDHVCPINQTKLMEPMLSTLFDGPQLDDIYGGTRAYGDDLEHNDTTASASDLGSLGNGTVSIDDVSVDDDSDKDYFMFQVGPNKKASITVTPIGATYLQGPQNPNGSCSNGTSFNSLVQNDLSVQVLAEDGVTVLGNANAHPAGEGEALANVALPSGAGTYFVRVLAGANNAAQLYRMSLTIGDAAAPGDGIFSDGFDGPSLDAWSAAATGGGDLSTSAAAAMGSARGLQAMINDSARIYVEDDTPDAETRYRARFWFDPNGFTPGDAAKKVQILQAFSRTPDRAKLVLLMVRRVNAQYQLMVKVRTDDVGMVISNWIPFSDDAHAIEIDWQRASASLAADGHLQLWLDGTSVANLTGLDNADHFLDFVRLGAVGVRPSSGGTIYFDRFVSRRSSYIGP